MVAMQTQTRKVNETMKLASAAERVEEGCDLIVIVREPGVWCCGGNAYHVLESGFGVQCVLQCSSVI